MQPQEAAADANQARPEEPAEANSRTYARVISIVPVIFGLCPAAVAPGSALDLCDTVLGTGSSWAVTCLPPSFSMASLLLSFSASPSLLPSFPAVVQAFAQSRNSYVSSELSIGV